MNPVDLEEMIQEVMGSIQELEKMMPAPEYILVGADGKTEFLGNSRQACLEYAMRNGIRGFDIEELWV